jgi:diguanylate cyclase (GGDEF)-like protein/PAS domain S-box-containing protein
VARAVLDASHEAFISMDADGRVIDWNRLAEQTFGYSRAEILGRDLAAAIVPMRYRAAHRRALNRFLATGESSVIGRRLELNALHHAGHELPVALTITAAPANGSDPRNAIFYAFVQDISLRRQAGHVLLAVQTLSRAMARADSPENAVREMLATLAQTMDWQIGAYWSLAGSDLEWVAGWTASGIDAAEFERLGRTRPLPVSSSFPGRALETGQAVWMEDTTAQDIFPRVDAARRAGLHGAISVPMFRKAEIVGAMEFMSTQRRVCDLSIHNALSTVGRQAGDLLGVMEDRQSLLAGLERLALTDQLTGLPNRRAWEEGLDREMARAARDGHELCVAVIDFDDFKRYNDEHGHQAGDSLLAETADAWRLRLRASDLFARYGGEEFAAVIPAWPLDQAITVIDRLRGAVPGGQTCSAGVARWNRAETAKALFGRADEALYAAKEAGRNRTIAAEHAQTPGD